MLGLSIRKLSVVFCIILFAGCMGTPRITDPERTAIEQLLLSTASDHAIKAIKEVDFGMLAGKKVFLDSSRFEAVDKGYAIGLFSIMLGKHGAMIVEDKKDAQIIASITSGTLSIDRIDKFFGLPSFEVPIPLTGQIKTPEIALYKKIVQKGIAKFAINVYEKEMGKQLLVIGPISGSTYCNYHKVFIIFTFHTTDIPEKKKGWWY